MQSEADEYYYTTSNETSSVYIQDIWNICKSGVRVSGNECIGKEITGDIEDPTRRELDIEDSTHELYFQSSCFNECLYASRR